MTEANEIGQSEMKPEAGRRRWHERPYEGPPAVAVAPASDIETVIRFSKWVEHALENRHGAVGKGLREKADSVADQLPPDVHAHLAFLGTVRNALAHDHGEDKVRNPERYNQTRAALIAFFRPSRAPSAPLPEPLGWSLVWRLLARIGVQPSELGRRLWPIRRIGVALAFVAALVPFLLANALALEPWQAVDASLHAAIAEAMPDAAPVVPGLLGAMVALTLAGLGALFVAVLLSEPVVRLGIALVDLALVLLAFTTSAWLLWQLRLLVS